MNGRNDDAHEHTAFLPPRESGSDGERARIERVYAAYRADGVDTARWAAEQAGNRCILEERHRRSAVLLSRSAPPARILEIGCGGGGVLLELEDITGAARRGGTIVGVDLLCDRLVTARHGGGIVAQADGRLLPFPDGTFDLVVTFTVFSSILDRKIRSEVASEVRRVLRPDGHLLWYDMRYRGANREIRPLRRRAVERLFAGMEGDMGSVTVLPPLARRLGERDRAVYPTLARLRFLRSHLIGLFREVESDG